MVFLDTHEQRIRRTRIRAAVIFAVATFGLLGLTQPIANYYGLTGVRWVLVAYVAPAIVVAVVMAFVYWFSNSMGEGFGSILFTARPAEQRSDYSLQEAVAASGDVAGALALYEARLVKEPDDVALRLRTADLYATRADGAARAAALYVEARRHPAATRAQTLYASQRLIDLYDGPLADPGRVVVELRRMIDSYPDTREGVAARDALARRKAELEFE